MALGGGRLCRARGLGADLKGGVPLPFLVAWNLRLNDLRAFFQAGLSLETCHMPHATCLLTRSEPEALVQPSAKAPDPHPQEAWG